MARAQKPERIRRIGVLMGYLESDATAQAWLKTCIQALEQLGWTRGHNIHVEYRWAGTDKERMRAYAAELVNENPAVIFATSTPVLAALQQQSGSIPIVFANVADPVGQGFVSSLARPGGRITGFGAFEFSMGGKWVEIIKEISPNVAQIAVIFHAETAPYFKLFLPSAEDAAASAGVKCVAKRIQDAESIERTINVLADESSVGVVVIPSILFTANRELIITHAQLRRIPVVYPWRLFAESGGLVAYGVEAHDIFRRVAEYLDRILKGADPAELPVQQPVKLELVINLKTAKVLGLTIPPTLLARADEVIE
jgi:putative ABC transport system substrate-binding protein